MSVRNPICRAFLRLLKWLPAPLLWGAGFGLVYSCVSIINHVVFEPFYKGLAWWGGYLWQVFWN